MPIFPRLIDLTYLILDQKISFSLCVILYLSTLVSPNLKRFQPPGELLISKLREFHLLGTAECSRHGDALHLWCSPWHVECVCLDAPAQ